MKTEHKMIQRVALSGLSHHSYSRHVDKLVPGVELALVAQSDNKFDEFAVAVHMLDDEGGIGDQIGWIPKGQNEMLHRLLRAEVEVRCKVISHETNKALAFRLYVGNYITVVA